MASGAIGLATPVADPGAGTLAMHATPTSRRPALQGLSPSARRSTRPEIVNDVGSPPKSTHIQLVQEVQRMHAQWAKDNALYGGYP